MSETIFRETIEVCDRAFQTLEAQIPAPIRVRYGDDFVFRYEKHTLEIVTIQKLSQPTLGATSWPIEAGEGKPPRTPVRNGRRKIQGRLAVTFAVFVSKTRL